MANKSTGKKRARLSPIVRFILTFIVSLAVGGAAYAYFSTSYHGLLVWVMRATTVVTGATLSLFTSDIVYYDQICSFKNFDVKIIDECTGVLEMVIYSAAVVAFPTTWRKKGIGILLGVPIIYVFNVLRIIVLLVVGAYSRSVFDFMHLYFWQATLVIMIASLWVGWLVLVVNREKRPVAVSE